MLLVAAVCAVALVLALIAAAATPSSGAITPTGPTAPFTGSWTGFPTGPGTPTEASCVEGVNCDTFRLTVSPGDYTGKNVQIGIQWSSAAANFDVYVHKCPTPASTAAQCNATAVLASSTSASGTTETTSFSPTASGTGDYTVHVVYLTGTAIEQYTGTVSLVTATAARLRSLRARIVALRRVRVEWRTASELDTLGFALYRSAGGELVRLNRTLIRAAATASGGHSYTWLDRKALGAGRRASYRLQAVGLDGSRMWIGSVRAR